MYKVIVYSDFIHKAYGIKTFINFVSNYYVMEVVKKIKAYGNTAVIQITKEELLNHKLKLNDIVDVTINKHERED